jgi:hypothetical protein
MYNVWHDMLEFADVARMTVGRADVAIGTGTCSLWRWVVVVGERGRQQNAFGIWGWISKRPRDVSARFRTRKTEGVGIRLLASRAEQRHRCAPSVHGLLVL